MGSFWVPETGVQALEERNGQELWIGAGHDHAAAS
jgi:hypothetical protein